jgi:hypothetical protein
MNTRRLAIWIVDIALCVSAVSALAAQPFGRDSVYATTGKTSTQATSQTTRFGRDSVYVAHGVVRTQPQSTNIAALKPGRK